MALPDNQHALSGSVDATIKLFNVNDGAVLRTFGNLGERVFCLALFPDGRRFVSGSHDQTACIVEHGLAPAPAAPAYVAAQKEALRARLKDEHRRHELAREREDRRHAEEVERLNRELVAVEASGFAR